ncbi:MAG: hypothetical protein ACKPKO_58340, partial [Candidatus Fonsibacter sp.]
GKWKDWFESSFYTHLYNSYMKVKAAGISPTRTLINLLNKHAGNNNGEEKARAAFESEVYNLLLRRSMESERDTYPPQRARHILQRWISNPTIKDGERLVRISKIIGKFCQVLSIAEWMHG